MAGHGEIGRSLGGVQVEFLQGQCWHRSC